MGLLGMVLLWAVLGVEGVGAGVGQDAGGMRKNDGSTTTTRFTRASLDEVERAFWQRVPGSFSDNVVVWLKHGDGHRLDPRKLEHDLRVGRGLPVSFVRKLFGTGVLLFRNERGVPQEDGGFTVAMLRSIVQSIKEHPSVRDCRVDLVVPKQNPQPEEEPGGSEVRVAPETAPLRVADEL